MMIRINTHIKYLYKRPPLFYNFMSTEDVTNSLYKVVKRKERKGNGRKGKDVL